MQGIGRIGKASGRHLSVRLNCGTNREPDMKRPLAVGVASLLIGIAAFIAVAQSVPQDEDARDKFVGAWRLAWLEQPGAEGKIRRIDCCGLLVSTRDGHMSVQVMEREPPARTPAGSHQYAKGGYEASHARCDVNDRDHTFTFHVEGALVRSLIGKDLLRAYELSGKQLIVKSTNPDEHWRVCWERY
jgi:Lipocalin-like domain